MAEITLIGMYNYDENLFDSLTLPTGIDKELFINTLLMSKGEFGVVYPDPTFLRNMIGVWGQKWNRTFTRWLEGTQAKWNPIENYDRYEDMKGYRYGTHSDKTTANYNNDRTANLEEKRTADLTDKRTANLKEDMSSNVTDTRTADLTDKRTLNTDDKTVYNSKTTDKQIVDATTDHDVYAFDSNSASPQSKDTTDIGTVDHEHSGDDTIKHSGTDTLDQTGTDTMEHTGSDSRSTTGTDTHDTTGTDTNTTTGTDKYNISGTLSDRNGHDSDTMRNINHIHGNIGVTQASEMLQSYYDISMWNLFDQMSDVFAKELLICIY